MLTILHLKTCDTCRKALKFLKEKDADFVSREIRQQPLTRKELLGLMNIVSWEVLINKASTTWRGLEQADKEELSQAKAIDLLIENPTLMKRPVFLFDENAIVGFKTSQQAELVVLLN